MYSVRTTYNSKKTSINRMAQRINTPIKRLCVLDGCDRMQAEMQHRAITGSEQTGEIAKTIYNSSDKMLFVAVAC